MSFFQGAHLQVTSVVTTNGLMPKIGDDGRVEHRITLLPLSARKALDRENQKLPPMLKKKIEVVGQHVPMHNHIEQVPPAEMEAMRAKIAELEAQNAALQKPAGEDGAKAAQQPKVTAEGAKK